LKVYDQFKNHFSVDNLTQIYDSRVKYSNATGIDNINQFAFQKQSKKQIEIISRKVISGEYNFTKYKLKLVSKGRGKVPREISIPTIRDRIAIRALCEFLGERFEPSLNFELPQVIISQVKKDISSKIYSGFIKLDVSDFYPSIVHPELKSRLRKRIKNPHINHLIESSLVTPTVSFSASSDLNAKKGVPQGLAISNILAEIYLINIDIYMRSRPEISYYRYVDDVLIFCDAAKAEKIANETISRFKKIGLSIHDPNLPTEKSTIGGISDQFDYLGYRFYNSTITARLGTIEKLRSSIVGIFTSYNHSKTKNDNFLLWRLNLRITGCIFENKSKGWLFFFSEINDETLLHALDSFVSKMVLRFGAAIKPKRFSRAFKELTHRRYETRYIPNFDKYDIIQKRQVLKDYFILLDVTKMNNDEVEYEFHKRVGKHVKELQEDIKDFS